MNPWRYVLRAIGEDNLSQVLVSAKAIVATDRHRMHAAPHGLGEGPWTGEPVGLTRAAAETFCRAKEPPRESLLAFVRATYEEINLAKLFPPWRSIVSRQPRIPVGHESLQRLLDTAKPNFSQWRHAAYDAAKAVWRQKTGDQRRERDDRPLLGDFCPTVLFCSRGVFGGSDHDRLALRLGDELEGWPSGVTGVFNAEYLDDATRGCTVVGLEILGGDIRGDGDLVCPLRIVTGEGCLALVQAMRL